MTDYSLSPTPIEDPTYGELVFYRKRWEGSDIPLTFEPLAWKWCSEQDFNWGDGRPTDEDSLFYPLVESSKPDIRLLGN